MTGDDPRGSAPHGGAPPEEASPPADGAATPEPVVLAVARDERPADRRRIRGAALAIGLVVLLVALAAAGLATRGDGDDGEMVSDAAAEGDRGMRPPQDATTTTAKPTTTAPQTITTGVPGEFEVSLPQGWGSTAVAGDMTGGGAEMFPDDPGHADLADTTLSVLATPQTVFLAMDGSGGADVTTTDILTVESGPANVSQDTAYETLVQSKDQAQIQRQGHAATAVGQADWLEFTTDVAGMTGRNYLLVHDGTAWLLTYWSGTMAERSAVADGIVASFRPL